MDAPTPTATRGSSEASKSPRTCASPPSDAPRSRARDFFSPKGRPPDLRRAVWTERGAGEAYLPEDGAGGSVPRPDCEPVLDVEPEPLRLVELEPLDEEDGGIGARQGSSQLPVHAFTVAVVPAALAVAGIAATRTATRIA